MLSPSEETAGLHLDLAKIDLPSLTSATLSHATGEKSLLPDAPHSAAPSFAPSSMIDHGAWGRVVRNTSTPADQDADSDSDSTVCADPPRQPLHFHNFDTLKSESEDASSGLAMKPFKLRRGTKPTPSIASAYWTSYSGRYFQLIPSLCFHRPGAAVRRTRRDERHDLQIVHARHARLCPSNAKPPTRCAEIEVGLLRSTAATDEAGQRRPGPYLCSVGWRHARRYANVGSNVEVSQISFQASASQVTQLWKAKVHNRFYWQHRIRIRSA